MATSEGQIRGYNKKSVQIHLFMQNSGVTFWRVVMGVAEKIKLNKNNGGNPYRMKYTGVSLVESFANLVANFIPL